MSKTNAFRLLAVAAILAATACAPVFASNDQAGLSPVSFSTARPTQTSAR